MNAPAPDTTRQRVQDRRKISDELLKFIATTPPGEFIDVPEADKPGLLWRLAKLLYLARCDTEAVERLFAGHDALGGGALSRDQMIECLDRVRSDRAEELKQRVKEVHGA